MNLSSTSASLASRFELRSALEQNLVVHQFIENAELQGEGFFLRRRRPLAFTRVRKYFSTSARWMSFPLTTAHTSGPGALSFLQPAVTTQAATATRTRIFVSSGTPSEAPGSDGLRYAAFVTRPERMQDVHTRTCLRVPFTTARTRRRFGFQRRRVTLFAWLMVFP